MKQLGLHRVSATVLLALTATVLMSFSCDCNEEVEKARGLLKDTLLTQFTGDNDQQHMVNPDFTDLGVGSLITNGRHRLNLADYTTLIYNQIAAIVNTTSPTTTTSISAPLADMCNPPLHGGWYTIPSTPGWYLPPPGPASGWPVWSIDPKIVTALFNSSPAVKSDFLMRIADFYAINRAASGVPNCSIFELVGLDAPLYVAGSTGSQKFTTVTLMTVTASSPSAASLYRVMLSYQP